MKWQPNAADDEAKAAMIRTLADEWALREPAWPHALCVASAEFEYRWIYGEHHLSPPPVGILGPRR